MAALDVRFAGFYFAAIESSLSGKATPGCWQALFDRRNQPLMAASSLLWGNERPYQPRLAAGHRRHLPGVCHSSEHGTSQYNDYSALNATLDSIIDAARQTLRMRLPGDALPPVSSLDDTLAAWSVAAAREAAWNNAELLWHLSDVPLTASVFLGPSMASQHSPARPC